MRVSSVVRDLQNHAASVCVHGSGYASPTCNLFGSIDSRRVRVTLRLPADCRTFRDDQSGGSALRVVLGVQRRRSIPGSRSHPGERRHDDTVWHLKYTKV
jgi:hypothetical protein